jgi:hypothetical protein
MNYEYEATDAIDSAKNMMWMLGTMNDLLELRLDSYMFDRLDDYTKDHEAIEKFVTYIINKNLNDIDEPRGREGWTYREAAAEVEKPIDTVPMLDFNALKYKLLVDDPTFGGDAILGDSLVFNPPKDFATVSCGQEEVPCSNVRLV